METPQRPWRDELIALGKLAAPIAATQLGWNLMGAVDVAMVGSYTPSPGAAATSTEQAMAAVSLGNAYVMGVQMPLSGVLMALDPLVAQAHGAGREDSVSRHVKRGLLFAVLLSLPVIVLLLLAEPLLEAFGQRADVAQLAAAYVRAALPGSVALLFFFVGRQVLQAVGRVGPLFVTVAVANGANALFNHLLVHGNGGFPELGAEGSGIATSASRFVMAILVFLLGGRTLWPSLRRKVEGVLDPRAMGRMLRLGAPIAVQIALEVWLFIAVTLLMGRMGTLEVDGHQVALQLAALAFMVPLSVGAAGATRVGQALGRGDLAGTRRAAALAMGVGVGVMVVSATAFVTVPGPLARLFTHEPDVVAMAVSLLPVAAAFQIFDGAQVVALGVLRGVADTLVPAVINLVGYWVLALPLALILSERLESGPRGLWWGLTAGLASVALLLLVRLRFVFQRLEDRSLFEDAH